jgi:hypothetical protein
MQFPNPVEEKRRMSALAFLSTATLPFTSMYLLSELIRPVSTRLAFVLILFLRGGVGDLELATALTVTGIGS